MANTDTLYKQQFGQQGSIFTDVDGAIKPPTNKVFIAIQMVDNSTFDATGGLVSDTSNDAFGCAGTNTSIHDASTQSVSKGTGGDAVDASNTFPAGLTIFGRWTEIDLDAGAIIAYIGS